MKKKSFKSIPKEEGFKFLNKIFGLKSKGAIYKIDWLLSSSTDSSNLLSTNLKFTNTKK